MVERAFSGLRLVEAVLDREWCLSTVDEVVSRPRSEYRSGVAGQGIFSPPSACHGNWTRESVQLVDGCGNRVIAILEVVERGIASLTIQQRLPFSPDGYTAFWHWVARASIFDQVIRQATEMGVDRIGPIQASRSVAKAGKPERWQKCSLFPLTVWTLHLTRFPRSIIESGIGASEDIDHVSILTPMSPLVTSSHGSQAVIGPEGWSDDEQHCRPGRETSGLGRQYPPSGYGCRGSVGAHINTAISLEMAD